MSGQKPDRLATMREAYRQGIYRGPVELLIADLAERASASGR